MSFWRVNATNTMTAFRTNATTAHILPLALFMLLNAAAAWMRVQNPELPWYQQAPEHWIYPLQTLLCGGLLVAFRKHYRLAPWRGFSLSVVLAGLGIAAWIAPVWMEGWYAAKGITVPQALRWVGVVPRPGGFNPTLLSAWPAWETASICMRFLRLVVIVPLVEEIFWRGFLMRYLAADDARWQSVPFGTHRWKAFFIVTIFVMLAHLPRDYAAAFIWGTLVYFLAVRTKSLGACILMHATGNLLLGIYIMASRAWGLW